MLQADFDTVLSIYLKIAGDFLFESVENSNNVGRYSIIAKGKKAEFVFRGSVLEIKEWVNGDVHSYCREKKNPLEEVRNYFSRFTLPPLPPDFPPFFGGALGYLGYETIRYFEKIPPEKEGIQVPDGILVIPKITVVVDNTKGLL